MSKFDVSRFFSLTGDIDFQTSHFSDFRNFKVDIYFANFGHIEIDPIRSLLVTVILLSLGKTCRKKQFKPPFDENSRSSHIKSGISHLQ